MQLINRARSHITWTAYIVYLWRYVLRVYVHKYEYVKKASSIVSWQISFLPIYRYIWYIKERADKKKNNKQNPTVDSKIELFFMWAPECMSAWRVCVCHFQLIHWLVTNTNRRIVIFSMACSLCYYTACVVLVSFVCCCSFSISVYKYDKNTY